MLAVKNSTYNPSKGVYVKKDNSYSLASGVYVKVLGNYVNVALVEQARAVLGKYGNEAHLYLPGVGAVNGITAGNWLDSAGTTPATVDNPVGLVIDAAGAVGPELVNNSGGAWGDGTAGLPSNTSFTQSGGTLTVTRGTGGTTGAPAQTIATVVGKTYRFSMTLTGSNGYTQPSNTTLVSGVNSFLFVATSANHIFSFWPFNTGTSFTIDNISVREITGIHASQNTTASKPILRLNSGIYSAQFDGVDDYLSLGSVPFQIGDNFAVVAGYKNNDTASYPMCLSVGNAALSRFELFSALGAPAVSVIGSVSQYIINPSGKNGVNIVHSAKKIGQIVTSRLNGQAIAGTIDVTGNTLDAFTGASIGANANVGGNYAVGHIYPVIAIKGTVSDADLLTLEKFVGSLSGVTL